jgi:hypothetical protein
MSIRPKVVFTEETATHITFRGGDFAKKEVLNWRFDLTDGKFTRLTVTFVRSSLKDEKGWLNDQLRDYLLDLLAQKYGKPNILGDGDHSETIWTFPDTFVPSASKTINLYYRWFGSEPRVQLIYSEERPQKPKATNSVSPKDDI